MEEDRTTNKFIDLINIIINKDKKKDNNKPKKDLINLKKINIIKKFYNNNNVDKENKYVNYYSKQLYNHLERKDFNEEIKKEIINK